MAPHQMAKEEERRRQEAEAAKARLESEQRKQGNEVTQMFDRLKLENEQVCLPRSQNSRLG